MIAVIQRVCRASVQVDGETVGAIGRGLLVLAGMAQGDTAEDIQWMARKIVGLRIFEDQSGRMNLNVKDISGGVLAVSQFTLLGDCRKGRRPSFSRAMHPGEAATHFNQFVSALRHQGVPVETGLFQAMMEVSLLNDGPVTLILDSQEARSTSRRGHPR